MGSTFNPFLTSNKFTLTQTPTKLTCTYTPPADQNISTYITRMRDIIEQLNTTKDITIANERMQLLQSDIRAAIAAATPTPTRDAEVPVVNITE